MLINESQLRAIINESTIEAMDHRFLISEGYQIGFVNEAMDPAQVSGKAAELFAAEGVQEMWQEFSKNAALGSVLREIVRRLQQMGIEVPTWAASTLQENSDTPPLVAEVSTARFAGLRSLFTRLAATRAGAWLLSFFTGMTVWSVLGFILKRAVPAIAVLSVIYWLASYFGFVGGDVEAPELPPEPDTGTSPTEPGRIEDPPATPIDIDGESYTAYNVSTGENLGQFTQNIDRVITARDQGSYWPDREGLPKNLIRIRGDNTYGYILNDGSPGAITDEPPAPTVDDPAGPMIDDTPSVGDDPTGGAIGQDDLVDPDELAMPGNASEREIRRTNLRTAQGRGPNPTGATRGEILTLADVDSFINPAHIYRKNYFEDTFGTLPFRNRRANRVWQTILNKRGPIRGSVMRQRIKRAQIGSGGAGGDRPLEEGRKVSKARLLQAIDKHFDE